MTATAQEGQYSLRALWQSAVAMTARPARVSALLVCIIAMSLADLYMTLTYVLNFGMLEMNPLARRLLEHGSTAELIMFKLTSVLLAVVILFMFRQRRIAELAAWTCFLGMALLTAHWFNYNAVISSLTAELHALGAVQEPRWVSLAPGN